MKMLKTYWKARKVFKFPHITLYKYKSHYWFNFYSSDVRWKPKWDYISIEDWPKIEISLFKYTFGIALGWKSNNKYEDWDSYWESLVSYLYLFNKDVDKTKEEVGFYIDSSNSERHPILSNNYLK